MSMWFDIMQKIKKERNKDAIFSWGKMKEQIWEKETVLDIIQDLKGSIP